MTLSERVSFLQLVPTREMLKRDADLIVQTHTNLRTRIRKGQSASEVWSSHLKDTSRLKQYAVAMQRVQKYKWDKTSESGNRVQWGHSAIVDYYARGGQERMARKEEVLAMFHRKSPQEKKEAKRRLEEEVKEGRDEVTVPEGKYERMLPLEVLDVGSCDNLFSEYSELRTTALDIFPASEDVYQCDFLKVKVGDSTIIHPPTKGSHEPPANDPAYELPKTSLNVSKVSQLKKEHYDVVIFSYLLSYLPLPAIRRDCCAKAYELLKPGGILVIMSPDPEVTSDNAFIFMCWRVTLARLGFHKVLYKKCDYFHGNVYRKALCKEVLEEKSDRYLYAAEERQKHYETVAEKKKFVVDDVVFTMKNRFLRRNVEEFCEGLVVPQEVRRLTDEQRQIRRVPLEVVEKQLKRKNTSSQINSLDQIIGSLEMRQNAIVEKQKKMEQNLYMEVPEECVAELHEDCSDAERRVRQLEQRQRHLERRQQILAKRRRA